MLTLDEIRNIQFTKGIGGYKTVEVDDFVDEVIATVTALTAERDEFKTKMNVIADKLLEYRQEEDNIHTALLSAQKMGDIVMKDAHARADQLIAEAEEKAAQIEKIARNEIRDEQHHLDTLKKQVADFKAELIELYKEHIELIQKLPEPEEPAVEEPVRVEPVVEEPIKEEPVAVPVQEQVPEVPAHLEEVTEMEDLSSEPVTEEDAVAEPENEEEQPAPFSKFADLRFGASYHIEDELDDEEEEEKHRLFKKKK